MPFDFTKPQFTLMTLVIAVIIASLLTSAGVALPSIGRMNNENNLAVQSVAASGGGGGTGDEGGGTGDEGGDTGDEGGDTGDEGGDTGDEGGDTGDEGGAPQLTLGP